MRQRARAPLVGLLVCPLALPIYLVKSVESTFSAVGDIAGVDLLKQRCID
jgi:hypothetical protein